MYKESSGQHYSMRTLRADMVMKQWELGDKVVLGRVTIQFELRSDEQQNTEQEIWNNSYALTKSTSGAPYSCGEA